MTIRWRLLIGVGAAPLALAARWIDPAVSAFVPPCAIYAMAGWYCTGCGTARAVHALAHGRFLDALHLNALAVIVLPLAAAALIDVRLDVFRRLGPRATWLALAVILIFGLIRNIPLFPFVLLAPR
jgi:hypothetical protein